MICLITVSAINEISLMRMLTFSKMKAWLVFLFFVGTYAKHESYIGWKSYAVEPSTTEQLQDLVSMIDIYELDFLSFATINREGVTLVKPQYQAAFTHQLDRLQIKYRVFANDVKQHLDYDDRAIEARNNAILRSGRSLLPYDNYQTLDIIYAYLDSIAATYPSTVTLVTPDYSFQGRPIKYLKISTTNFEDISKPIIFIDGGIHAREWISPPTVTWAIRNLVEHVTEPDLLNNYDWILLPVANPDGYEFTFTNERFWRKTRSTDSHMSSRLCPGVDGNRNFDFFWNTVGVSSNPCSDTYPGNRTFSEVETRVVRDIIDDNLNRIALYLTMHSYGSMILYPWGHDGSLSQNAFALHTVGVAMAEVIDSLSLPNFPSYIVGNSVLVLNYRTSGSAEDYAHLKGVPLSFTYELPGFGQGVWGFNLNPIYIQQVVEETWAAISVGVRRAGALFESKIN